MAKTALFLTRDMTGLAALAQALGAAGFRLRAVEAAAKVLASRGIATEVLELSEAAALIADDAAGVEIVAANFREPGAGERSVGSWKKVYFGFDFAIAASVRAAAARPDRVAILGSPEAYAAAGRVLAAGGKGFSQADRVGFAIRALHATGDFDGAAAGFLETNAGEAPDVEAISGYLRTLRLTLPKAFSFPSGDNRHQKAALYGPFDQQFRLLAGPKFDYDSIASLSEAIGLIGEFLKPTIGLARLGMVFAGASGDSIDAATAKALASRSRWPNGSVAVLNMTVNRGAAETLLKLKATTILAPRFDEEATAVLEKDPAVRLLTAEEGMGYESLLELRSVAGGVLAQDRDLTPLNPMKWSARTLAQPLVNQWENLIFAAKLARRLRSASCVAVSEETTRRVESGQASQGDAWERMLASGFDLSGCVLAFDEAVENTGIFAEARSRGVDLIVHPGHGDDARDREIRQAADAATVSLVETGISGRRLA